MACSSTLDHPLVARAQKVKLNPLAKSIRPHPQFPTAERHLNPLASKFNPCPRSFPSYPLSLQIDHLVRASSRADARYVTQWNRIHSDQSRSDDDRRTRTIDASRRGESKSDARCIISSEPEDQPRESHPIHCLSSTTICGKSRSRYGEHLTDEGKRSV
jgi:hypothetical protein